MAQKTIVMLAALAVVIFIGTLAYALANAPAPKPAPVAQAPAPGPADDAAPKGDEHTDDPADALDKPAPNGDAPKFTPAPVNGGAAAVEAAPVYEIRPVAVDGADVADLLGLNLYKFAYSVPRGRYTLHVWAERWTRDGQAPAKAPLSQAVFGEFSTGSIVIKPPTTESPEGLVKVERDGVRGAAASRPVEPLAIASTANRRALAEALPIGPGDTVNLISYVYSAEGQPKAGLNEVHRDNDVTVYIRARFVPGEFTPFEATPADADAPAAE